MIKQKLDSICTKFLTRITSPFVLVSIIGGYIAMLEILKAISNPTPLEVNIAVATWIYGIVSAFNNPNDKKGF